jgi:parvulin-like peptidyl-prolyl isomerase
MPSGRLSKLRRAHALHFVLLGAVLFFLQSRVLAPAGGTAPGPTRQPIIVGAERIEQIRSDYQQESGSAPSADVVRNLIDDWITDELLYREARAIGLDRGDRSIKWRLAEKMRFISERPDGTPDELYQEALQLGLDRDDVVVRRILVQKMRLLTKTAITRATFDDADLQRFFDEHRDDYMQPARATLSHVFFSSEKRGEAAQVEAERLLPELRSQAVAPKEAAGLGDPFPLGHDYRASSAHHLQKIFGVHFADRIFQLKAKEWSGPIRSAYGFHVVWLDEIEPEKLPPFDVVRSRIEQRFLSERREKHLEETLQRLRQLYGVRIESTV